MITYRKATLDDIEALACIRADFLIEADPQTNWQEMHDANFAYIQETLPKDEFVVWMAVEDDKIIGTVALCFYRLPPSYLSASGEIAYILNVYTLPEHRGRGIAPELLDRTVEEAKSRGYKKITLNATKMGRPVYLRYGFEMEPNEMVYYIKD